VTEETELASADLSTLFRAWLRTTENGERLVYFSGNLAAARQQHQKIAEGANTVWREGYLAGLVRLTQRNRSDGPGHDYIATRCQRPPIKEKVQLSANFDRERNRERA
jgi:hypothetical protein